MKYNSDPTTLEAYSSDGSIYAVTPKAVRHIRSIEDISEAVVYAQKKGLSVTARGGGTGLVGGALGDGLILDFSDFRKILDIDIENRLVKTEAGIVYDELNLALKEHGLFFPPDPSSGDTCQIGGMLANNASGPRSVKYGLTSDFVETLEIIDARGHRIILKKLPLHSAESNSFFGDYPEYQKILNLLEKNREQINSRWPKLKKNSSGYNLKQVVDDLEKGVFNLPALLIGSEGTLGLIATATLRLLPIPKEKLTTRLYFKSPVYAGKAAVPIRELGPSGLEIVDGSTLTLIGREKYNMPPDAGAMLLVEFDDGIESKKPAFEILSEKLGLLTPIEFADDPEATADLWRTRRAIVPTLYRHHPTKRPLPIIEDVSLPPEEVASFIEYITDLFNLHNLTFGIFGHIGDGNLHIRPLFDLNDEKDFNLVVRLYDIIYDRIIALGGSVTAEHADGRLRAQVVKRQYGDKIYSLFLEIKSILDPGGILSPGNILSESAFTENIDYEKIKLYCAACGKCNGYCPVYDIFRREDYSPRGWLRIISQSDEPREALKKHLSYCLNCKNCTTVCPAEVDIAGEILKWRAEKPSFLSKVAIAFTDQEELLNLSLRLGRVFHPIMNKGFGKEIITNLGKPAFGLDETFCLPRPAQRSLRKRFSDRLGESGQIAFFHGCADNLLESRVGEAVFTVFDRLGVDLKMPEQKCCGLPQEVAGHRDNLLKKAKYNIDRLNRFDAVITGCASCLLRLKEYPNIFDENDKYKKAAEELAGKCYDISQFLNSLNPDWSIFNEGDPIRVTYHNPCHLRAAGLHLEPEKMLSNIDGIEIIHPLYADSCCGQAGSYGYTHFQEAKRMFQKKKDAYKKIEADYLMTSCPACQMKIRTEMGDTFRVVHPIEILAERLRQ